MTTCCWGGNGVCACVPGSMACIGLRSMMSMRSMCDVTGSGRAETVHLTFGASGVYLAARMKTAAPAAETPPDSFSLSFVRPSSTQSTALDVCDSRLGRPGVALDISSSL